MQMLIDGIKKWSNVDIVVSKKMFDLMSKVKVDAKDKEMQQYMNLLKKLDNLQAYYTSQAT